MQLRAFRATKWLGKSWLLPVYETAARRTKG